MLQSITLAVFASASLFHLGGAIYCYQCSSNDLVDPFQCQEMFPEDNDIAPQSCDEVYGASYCIKHTGRFEGGVGTRRFCSSVDMGNYCDYIKQPGDNLEYRSCVYTCSSDGCNAGPVTKPLSYLVILLPSVFFYLTR